MLETIRNRAQGWFAWAFIILLIIPFAMWGISRYVDNDTKVNVATVNDQEISINEFQQAYQRQRSRLQSMLGKNFDPSLIDDKQLKKNVLESLIRRHALIQGAHKAGMRVSGIQVGAEIRAIPQLQTKGKFDPDLYKRLLRSQGLSVGTFEHEMGNDLLVQQLNKGIADSAFVTKQELDDLLRIKLQQRDIGFALVPVASYMNDATVDDKAIEKFYKDNPDRYRIPEQVSVDYVELSVDKMAKDIKVTEDDLRQSYKDHAGDFTAPEERHVRHILIDVASDAPPDKVAAAKKKAEDLLARIRKGESFADLAKKYSQDPGSAKQGGDLGFFGHGVMDKAFEKAAYALKVGEVSEPVRSTFGFHLIKLEGIRGGERKPFEQVRAQLEKDIKHQRAQDKFYDQADTLSNLAFEHADSLTQVSQTLHLPILTSGMFTRSNGAGIASNPKIREAAYSDDVLLGGKNSEAVELADDDVVVLRLKEHKPSALRPLAEVHDAIRQQLRLEAAKKKVKEVGEDIVHRLKAGGDVAAVLSPLKLKWERPGFVSRTGSKTNPQVVQAAFSLNRPADAKKPEFDGKAMPSGDFAVYGVYAVKDGDPAAADKKTVDQLKTTLAREQGDSAFKGFTDALKDTMKITRHEDQL